jgi:hypothetical protein
MPAKRASQLATRSMACDSTGDGTSAFPTEPETRGGVFVPREVAARLLTIFSLIPAIPR